MATQFQFPSNGKAHSDPRPRSQCRFRRSCFNSLQTGRHIQTISERTLDELRLEFQFPSNGKAHSDEEVSEKRHASLLKVSIPFKREGTFRRSPGPRRRRALCVSIPFKREGTFRPNFRAKRDFAGAGFQFPSNGKAHSDRQRQRRTRRHALCFNSLQTGRHIQTTIEAGQYREGMCFNSLQTGRHIQTYLTQAKDEIKSTFQFPSNGKAHSDNTHEISL